MAKHTSLITTISGVLGGSILVPASKASPDIQQHVMILADVERVVVAAAISATVGYIIKLTCDQIGKLFKTKFDEKHK